VSWNQALLSSIANALEGQKKKAVSLFDETSKNQANNGHLPNVEETFLNLAEFDGINFSGLIGLDDFDFRNASSLDMMISGAPSFLDVFSGSADSGSLFSYEHQSFSDPNPGWQYTTRMTTQSTNPPSLNSQETDVLTSWPPRNKSALPSTILPSPYRTAFVSTAYACTPLATRTWSRWVFPSKSPRRRAVLRLSTEVHQALFKNQPRYLIKLANDVKNV